MDGFWLDILLLIPIAWGLVRGLYKGIVMSIASFVGLIIAIILANRFSADFSVELHNWFVFSDKTTHVISYFAIFVVVSLLCFFIAKLLDKFLKIVTLSWLNRLLGAIFGVIKYALILSVLINLANELNSHIPFISEEKRTESILYMPLKEFVPAVLPYAKSYIDGENEESV
ncbi:MAG: CvpA family protein [Bacteroidia bacterium]|nr:CvpA family protein [Bacteroidia bacterium]